MCARAEIRFYIGLVAVFALATTGWLAIASLVPAAVGGWESVVITSGSMQPTIAPGDVVVAAPFNGEPLPAGSVVVFRDGSGGLVTHRVVRGHPDGTYLTAGDANREFDSTPLEPDRVVGVGRYIVPLAGLPQVWRLGGNFHSVAGLVLVLVATARLAPYGLLDRYCPWVVGRAADPGRRRRRGARRRWFTVAAVGIVLSFATASVADAAARFSGATSNPSNSWTAASTFGATWYLKTSGGGDRTSTPTLPLAATVPTASVLPNYDTDRDQFPGLVVAKGAVGGNASETDPTKYQSWSQAQTGTLTLSGTARLRVWTAVKGFQTGKRGAVWAYLQDCSADGSSCTTFDSALVDIADWSGGSTTWIPHTWDFGPVSRTISAGRTLQVKLVVDGASADYMWFAYDTAAYPSALTVT